MNGIWKLGTFKDRLSKVDLVELMWGDAKHQDLAILASFIICGPGGEGRTLGLGGG